MPRPFKTGLDYFELDCVLDDKIRMIQAEYGLKGFALVVKLYQKIYGGFGYYCEWNDDVSLLFTLENGLTGGDTNLINDIVLSCIKRDIFSKELFEKYQILTSAGIQKRYFNAVARRENVNVKKEYLLVCVRKKQVYDNKNGVNVNNNSKIVDDNTQRKEKKRKEKNKEREGERESDVSLSSSQPLAPTLFGIFKNVDITNEQYESLKEQYENTDKLIDKVSMIFANSSKHYENHYAFILKIALEDNWTKKKKIYRASEDETFNKAGSPMPPEMREKYLSMAKRKI